MKAIYVRSCSIFISGNYKHYADIYRALNKGMRILLSNSQVGPDRKVKQEQEEIFCNHVQAFIPGSVLQRCFGTDRAFVVGWITLS